MKARDPLRFAEIDQTRFTRTSRKRKLGDGAQESALTTLDEQLVPLSSPSCSSDNEKATWSSSDEESLRIAPTLIELPGRSFAATIPSLTDGRPFPARSMLKAEELSLAHRGPMKPSVTGELPRKFPVEKGPVVSRYIPGGPTASQGTVDGSLASSSAPRGVPHASHARGNKQRGRRQ
jgi:hypothetical protein